MLLWQLNVTLVISVYVMMCNVGYFSVCDDV